MDNGYGCLFMQLPCGSNTSRRKDRWKIYYKCLEGGGAEFQYLADDKFDEGKLQKSYEDMEENI